MAQRGTGGFQRGGRRGKGGGNALAGGQQRHAGRVGPDILGGRRADGIRQRAFGARAAQRRGDRIHSRAGRRQHGRLRGGGSLRQAAVDGQQRGDQAVERVLVVGNAGHGQHVGPAGHFGLKPVVFAQRAGQRRAGARAADKELARIVGPDGRVRGGGVGPMAQHPQRAKAPHGGRKAVQPAPPGRKQFPALFGQQRGAAVQADQQRVGRRACLEHIELALDLVGVDAPACPQVQQRGLGQAGQRFVRALDHKVRPGRKRPAAPAVRLRQRQIVRAVRFVHDQRHAVRVADTGNGGHVAEHAFIGRAGQDDAGRAGAGFERGGNAGGRHAAIDAEGGVDRRGQPVRAQAAELDGMVNRFMAVARAEDRAAVRRGGADGRQNAAGAAADKIPAARRPPQRRRARHGRGQNAFGRVQVVGSGDLGRVPGIAGKARRGRQAALVAGHVQRVGAARAGFQRGLQRG